MENNSSLKTFCTFKTSLNADSVEWCPHEPYQNVFACGNYQLFEQNDPKSKRLGQILLFSFSKEDGLELHQTLETPGILDQKWCHKKVNGQSLLGVSTAIGQIVIYALQSLSGLSLKSVCTCIATSSDILVLSLDWSTGIFEYSKPQIICSDSKGNIHMAELYGNDIKLLGSWKGHVNNSGNLTFEAWVAGFYYWDINLFFSGGDDGILNMYDYRIGKDVVKNKSHSAGVTSLHSNFFKEYVLSTGSYDQHIRIWDIRNLKEETSKVDMSGEVWRIKWDPFKGDYVLAACMYNGMHIVNFESLTDGKIVGSYYEHKNITYGIDWCHLDNNHATILKNNFIIGSCSFYDNLLCISEFDKNRYKT